MSRTEVIQRREWKDVPLFCITIALLYCRSCPHLLEAAEAPEVLSCEVGVRNCSALSPFSHDVTFCRVTFSTSLCDLSVCRGAVLFLSVSVRAEREVAVISAPSCSGSSVFPSPLYAVLQERFHRKRWCLKWTMGQLGSKAWASTLPNWLLSLIINNWLKNYSKRNYELR